MKLFQNSFVLFLKAFPLDLVKTFVLRASGSGIVFVKKPYHDKDSADKKNQSSHSEAE